MLILSRAHERPCWGCKLANETKRQRLNSLKKQVTKDRQSSWDSHYQELGNYILPRRYRLTSSEHNDGKKKQSYIIDSTGTRAARTLRAGMHSGSTNPARPWFRLATPDPDMMEFGAVKEWLFLVEKRMRDKFLRSNLYNALPVLYGDAGVFGTAAMAFMEDFEDGMRFYPFLVGTYALATNERNQVDTIVRENKMTVRQIVTRFGDKTAGPNTRWDNFSTTVRNMWDNQHYEQTIDVVHCVLPNPDADPSKLAAKFKPWQSTYYEAADNKDDVFLRESGFDEFPILAPRWEVAGDDTYGSSPGMESLGDIKALQTLHRRKAEAIDKQVRPPMTAPSALRGKAATQLPGGITFLDVREGQKGFRPSYEVKPEIQGMLLDIQDHQQRISSTFYEDLFLMLATSDRRQITAREIEERHEEKLIMLGPVLERMYDELHDPLINRTFNLMLKQGEIPPPPPELEDVDLKVEYISIMAQAQKAVATASIDQFAGYISRVAQAQAAFGRPPDVLDKFDIDQSVDEYGDFVGVPPTLIRSDEAVAKIRKDREAAQQRAQQNAAMEQAATTARDLSQASTEEGNALSDLLQGV